MRALLVILSALGAAVLVMGLVRSWQSRKALKTGQPPEQFTIIISLVWLSLGWSCGGAWWLESNSVPPDSTYSPARIENGT